MRLMKQSRWKGLSHRRFHAAHRSRQLLLVTMVTMCVALFAPTYSLAAEPTPVAEDQIKAAMIYKFLSYVDWPAHRTQKANEPFEIVFMGGHDIYQELREIVAGVSIAGRSIELRRAKNIASIGEPHAIFVGRDSEHHLNKLASLARQRSFLVITENEDGLVFGSTINLKIKDGRMGFGVSLAAAENAGLRLSARLLAIAHQVEQAGS